jgi:16S rRNA (uracil1498-N3)-methyltransferase
MTRKSLLHNESIANKDEILVKGASAHHLVTVLRVKRGEQIEVRDGLGTAWLGEVTGRSRQGISVRKLRSRIDSCESSLSLTLAIAYGRTDRMDLILRQATELGVTRVVPFRAARSQYGLDDKQLKQRGIRWTRIAGEALRQSGRANLPSIEPLPDVEALLVKIPEWGFKGADCLRILAWEEEHQQGLLSLWRECPHSTRVLVAIGPEGGFTREEAALFCGAGFFPVSLGPRTLRLETAATALLTVCQLLWGDLACQRSDGGDVPEKA